MTTTGERLSGLIQMKSIQASNGMSTVETDRKIAELEAEETRDRETALAAEEFDFSDEVEGANEEDIKQRATSEGPFVEPSAPGTFIGEIWKIERDVVMKDWPVYKVSWRSKDKSEPACRGTLFCEMNDNSEWVLTRCVLENLG